MEIQRFKNCLYTSVTSLPLAKDNIGSHCSEPLAMK